MSIANVLNKPVEAHEMGSLLVAIFSAIGTTIIFDDVKCTVKGLLHLPLVKFMTLYAFCYTILNKDKVKALYGAWGALVVYTFLVSISHRYPKEVAGSEPIQSSETLTEKTE